MNTQLPTGRERRRTDLYGRTRRFLYGLLLLAAAPGAQAADGLSDVGKYRAQTVASASVKNAVLATLQGLVVLHAEQAESPEASVASRNGYPRLGLDTITARMADDSQSPLFRVAITDDPSVKDGVGFDLAVPDLGNLHLNLYTRRNDRQGVRYGASTGDGAAPAKPTWSLGGSLELVRTLDGSKHVAFVPELLIDLDNPQNRFLPFQAAVKFANWRSIGEKRSLDEEVAQITFKWRL